jgi:hypothetical protein
MLRVGYIALIILTLNMVLPAQVAPPSLRCISIGAAGDATLKWVAPADPGGQFFSYEIFHSALATGPFTNVGTISSIGTTSFTHAAAGGNTQSQYYFMRTRFGTSGANFSANSDTLRSIFVNTLFNSGIVSVVYNPLKFPPLSSTSPNFSVLREFPTGTWSNLVNTSSLSFNDTITICTVFHNYQVIIGDASGCTSVSNIKGGTFKNKFKPPQIEVDSVSVLPNGQTVVGYPVSSAGDCGGYIIYQVINNINTKMDSVPGRTSTLYTFTSTAATASSVAFHVAPVDSCNNLAPISDPKHTTMFLDHVYDKCGYQTNLFWNAYTGWKSGVSEYRIYYSVNGGNYQLAGTTTQNNFIHTGVDPSKNVSYYVRAFNGNKSISSSSNRIYFFTQQTVAPDFIYVRSVSVTSDESIQVRFLIDSLKVGNGFDVYRSEEGSNFSKVGFISFNGSGNYAFNDNGLKTRERSYYYKAVAKDSCNNDRTSSMSVASIYLKVNNVKDNMFNKKLSWNNYNSFAGGIAGYSIYRVVNDVIPSSPSAYTNGMVNEYIDNVEDLAPEGSKIEYMVSAIEGLSNPYGITETARSNLATTYVEADVFVPTAFAPRGVNKVWKPVTHFVDKTDYNLKIYSRWGNLIFETNDDTEGWTGKDATNDVYVYLISFKNARGEYIQMKGTFTLL